MRVRACVRAFAGVVCTSRLVPLPPLPSLLLPASLHLPPPPPPPPPPLYSTPPAHTHPPTHPCTHEQVELLASELLAAHPAGVQVLANVAGAYPDSGLVDQLEGHPDDVRAVCRWGGSRATHACMHAAPDLAKPPPPPHRHPRPSSPVSTHARPVGRRRCRQPAGPHAPDAPAGASHGRRARLRARSWACAFDGGTRGHAQHPPPAHPTPAHPPAPPPPTRSDPPPPQSAARAQLSTWDL